MEYWSNLASIVSSFFSIGTLIICLSLYRRMKTRFLHWLSILLSCTIAMLIISSFMIVMELLILDRTGSLPDWYYRLTAALILLLFILHVVYLIVLNVAAHIFTSLKKRGGVENGTLVLIFTLLFIGFITWISDMPLAGFSNDQFWIYSALCRDISFAYVLYKLLRFDIPLSLPILRKIRMLFIATVGLVFVVCTVNDSVWIVSERWLFHFSDTFVNLFLISTILVSLAAYVLNDAAGRSLRYGPEGSLKSGLTMREQDVFNLLIQGSTYQQVSDSLYLSLDTVKTHSRSIYKKAGVSGKKELMGKHSPSAGQ